MKKLRISPGLHEQLCKEALRRGYADADEFAAHILERVLGKKPRIEDADVDARLKGLGYFG